MSLKKNIFGLGGVHFFNYIIPLLQLPYLSRVLGLDAFGYVIFLTSLIAIIQVFTDYGLDIYLTKKINDSNRSIDIINGYLSSVMTFKFLLCIILVFLFLAFRRYFDDFYDVNYVVLLICAVNAFNIRWLFYSIEMAYVYAIMDAMLKVLLVLLTYNVIEDVSDLRLYMYLVFFSSAALVVISHIYILKKQVDLKVRFDLSIKPCLNIIEESFVFLLSRVSNSAYSLGGSIVLGTYSSMYQLALYSSAEKLFKAGIGVFSPIVTALTPYMVRHKNYTLILKLFIIINLVLIPASLFVLYFGKDLLEMIFGSDFVGAENVLNGFMLVSFASLSGMLIGYPTLLPIGLEKYANYSVIFSGLLMLLIVGILLLINIEIHAFDMMLIYLVCEWSMFCVRIFVIFKYRSRFFED